MTAQFPRFETKAAGGYTLVELLAVMAVMGILAAAALPLAEMVIQRERERELRRGLWEVREAIDAYKRAFDSGYISRAPGSSGYPPDLQTLVRGVPSSKPGTNTLYFLRRIPRDPFMDATPADPAASWGLRSYRSPAEQPRPGEDVYDIYSRSDKIGLDGRPLRTW